MKSTLLLTIISLISFQGFSQSCDTSTLEILETRAKDTDTNIGWELKKHFSFYNPSCTSRDILLVHFVGSYDNPENTLLFPSVAANNGFHVVSLKYPNGTAARTACENSTDPNCYLNFRKEILEGIDYSPDISVDGIESAYNRLLKLLQYLDQNNTNQNWGSFYSGNNINWSKIIVSGHSQGGGHAGVIGIDKPVKRILMFASPNDYSEHFSAPATWTTASHIVADSNYYGFNNTLDGVVNFWEQFEMWDALGMDNLGDTVNVLQNSYPYSNTRQLYTDYDTTGVSGTHGVMIHDDKTPIDNQGIPLFAPVWKYMLGIVDTPNTIDENQNFSINIFPNPTNEIVSLAFSEPFTGELILTNTLGDIVWSNNSENKIQYLVNLEPYSKGIYFLQIKKENQRMVTKKIIKL